MTDRAAPRAWLGLGNPTSAPTVADSEPPGRQAAGEAAGRSECGRARLSLRLTGRLRSQSDLLNHHRFLGPSPVGPRRQRLYRDIQVEVPRRKSVPARPAGGWWAWGPAWPPGRPFGLGPAHAAAPLLSDAQAGSLSPPAGLPRAEFQNSKRVWYVMKLCINV